MCSYKEDGVLQVFAAILKKLSAQGTNKVDYGKHILKGMVIWGGKLSLSWSEILISDEP